MHAGGVPLRRQGLPKHVLQLLREEELALQPVLRAPTLFPGEDRALTDASSKANGERYAAERVSRLHGHSSYVPENDWAHGNVSIGVQGFPRSRYPRKVRHARPGRAT